jgi:hypothetical protein
LGKKEVELVIQFQLHYEQMSSQAAIGLAAAGKSEDLATGRLHAYDSWQNGALL